MFVHLHGHSHYSLLEALGSPKQIIEKAKKLQMPAIAITDYENMYGAIEFYKTALENQIKPILGVELNFTQNIKIQSIQKKYLSSYITILTKSYKGYKNLIKLTSFAQTKGLINGKAFIDFETLNKYKEDLIIIIGGERSLLGKMIKENTSKNLIEETIKKLIEIVGKENIFLEVQPQKPESDTQLFKINKKIIQLAEHLKIDLVVNNNFHYISKEDKEAFGILRAINELEIFDPNKHLPKGEYHIFSEEEILENLKYFEIKPKIIENNLKIAENINIQIPLGQILFPKYEVNPKTKKLYEKYKDQLIEQ